MQRFVHQHARHFGGGFGLLHGYAAQWDLKPKTCALPLFAADANGAALQSNQSLANRQAQTCAAVLAIGLYVGVLKALEDLFLTIWGNANASVLHFKQNAATHALHANIDAAFGSKFDRVVEQVFEHLHQTLTVTFDPHAVHRVGIKMECDVFALCFALVVGKHVCNGFFQGEFIFVQRQFAGFQL